MTRQARAKQFLAFDAMKGLSEALKEREERRNAVEKIELCEEDAEKISRELSKMEKGCKVKVTFYRGKRYETVTGTAEKVDFPHRFFTIGERRVYFEDVYRLETEEKPL